MKRINVLSRHIANQIAAGEVVERPASVVKELVENALDASSSAVTIETLGGGIDYLRITDNGGGIVKDDVKTAFLPHATSKIADAEDLEHIETLGFRGEALASVAAVAKVALKTRVKGEEAGSSIRVEGGQFFDVEDAGCPEGTTVEVSDLFYNIPARLKFLKHARAESGYISDYVSRMILSHPHVAFKLISNGKTVYQSAGDNSLYNAVYCVYGPEVLPHLRPVRYDDGYICVTGFIGTEMAARSTRMYQSFFVNGRYIKSSKLSFTVQRAFDTRLMAGKFPFAVLDITLSSREVDVNVHPNKLEVRFKDEDRVQRAVYAASRIALEQSVYDAGAAEQEAPAQSNNEAVGQTAEIIEATPKATHAVPLIKQEEPEFGSKPYVTRLDSNTPALSSLQPVLRQEGGAKPVVRESMADFSFLSTAPAMPVREQSGFTAFTPAEAPLQLDMHAEPYKIIGALFDSYWVVQQGDAVYFFDQHAVHERRLYEQMTKKGLQVDSQILLMPLIVKLSPLEYETLLSNMEQFQELGFDMDELGPLTMAIRAVPYVVGQPQTAEFLREALSQLDRKKRVLATDIKRAMLIQSACKHAVKAGDPLSKAEIEALLVACKQEGIPMTCPHGRPVMVKMSKLEFEKLFKRVV